MIVALTGSTGFLGRAIAQAVLEAGHTLVAVLRPERAAVLPADGPWVQHPAAQCRWAALNDQAALTQVLQGCDVVIHAAAALEGDQATQHAVTVDGTRQLLAAMQRAGVARLVGISSLSVYDYLALADGATLDEHSALEAAPWQRDVYARCKGEQDALFRAFAQQPGCTGVTLRPGVIVDESRLWNFSLGRALGAGAWLALGPQGPGAEVPLVHVADVAAAVVLALSPGPADGQVLNLVTCPAPERGALLAALSRAPTGPGVAPRRVVRLPWPLHLALARGVSGLNRLLAGRLPLPGLLRPARLQAQFRPLHYSAALAQARLGWRPRWPFLPLPTKAAP